MLTHFVLTQFGCNFVKAGKCFGVGEEHEERKKKSLCQMSYQEIRHTQHFCQALCVFVCKVILSIKGYTFIHVCIVLR